MFDIYGKYTSARVYSDICDGEAQSQIFDLCNHPVYEGAKIRIMPDVHAGVGCTIGTTVYMDRKAVIPSIVGSDIGCGVLTTVFELDTEPNYQSLDNFIVENIPYGMNIRKRSHPELSRAVKRQIGELKERLSMYKVGDAFVNSVGTLGGGNHYIELGLLDDGKYALSVHTGSRGLGKCVAEYFGDVAKNYLHTNNITGVNRSLPYIEGDDYDSYITEMLVCADMAAENRRLITLDILKFLGSKPKESFDTVHNYIEVHRGGGITVRKGAISAKEGQLVAIPLNMRDGVLICRGKGNTEWNYSAPHGAGRLLSRAEAKQCVSMEEYEESMRGINTWSVLPSTLDESPLVYKPCEVIMEQIKDTVDILYRVRPLYNFKARGL